MLYARGWGGGYVAPFELGGNRKLINWAEAFFLVSEFKCCMQEAGGGGGGGEGGEPGNEAT